MGVGTGSGSADSGLPTLVLVALVVGVPVVLVLMCGIAYYFKSERRMRARKEGVVGMNHHPRHHHHHPREIKDLSLTAPCLPRSAADHPPPPPTQPPQPPDSVPIHHRFQPPPSCMPYSVSGFLSSLYYVMVNSYQWHFNILELIFFFVSFKFQIFPPLSLKMNAIYGVERVT